ncbi:MAG TPA: protease pro-enzyme activation domain-containing protein, partial [Bradyrhizobium sp.]|nr:protease pro-enzyme activation domain-containing protein [Bradyrhizobium sp.]
MASTPVKLHAIPNSERLPAAGAVAIAAADSSLKMTVTLRLRRRPGAPPPPAPGAAAGIPPKSRHYMSREEFEQKHGAAAADIDSIRAFAAAHGMTLTESSTARRTAVLAGTVAQM